MSSKGAVDYKFIFLKIKGKKGQTGKKILIPNTLAILRKNATKLFNFPANAPVRSFYDENLNLIKDINDIVPGSTVFCSSEVQDEEMTSSTTIQQNAILAQQQQLQRLQQQQNSSALSFNSPSQVSFGSPQQSPSRISQVGGSPLGGNPSFFSASPLPISGSPSGLRSSLMSRPVSTLQSRPGSRAPSSLMVILPNEDGAQQQKRRRRKDDTFGMDDADQFENEDNDAKRFATTGISHRALERLLAFLPPEITLSGNGIEEVVDHLSSVVARLGSQAQNLQTAQEAHLYRIIGQRLRQIPQHSPLIDEKCVELVNNATFGTSCGSTMHFRHVVVGPSKGGKSVFLDVLGNVILLRLVASGQYKRTLFFNFDFLDFEEVARVDPIKFYSQFVRHIFRSIARQRIDFAPYCESVIAYFQRLTTIEKVTLLPQPFSVAEDFRATVAILSEIAKNIFKVLNEEKSLSTFLTQTFILPRYLAQAFGFNDVQFVVDHVDASDFTLIPEAPLDGDSDSVILLEYMKFMLSNDSFVISCIDSENFIDALDLTEPGGVDLRDGTELIPITDIDNGHSNAYEYVLHIEGGPQKEAKLRLLDCGGCSGFLSKWDEIIQQTKDYEEKFKIVDQRTEQGRNFREARETKLQLLAKLRELAPLVIMTVDSESETIEPLSGTIKDFDIKPKETEENMSNAHI